MLCGCAHARAWSNSASATVAHRLRAARWHVFRRSCDRSSGRSLAAFPTRSRGRRRTRARCRAEPFNLGHAEAKAAKAARARARAATARGFGSKLRRIAATVAGIVADGERVLVFAQFPDLMDKIDEALAAAGVRAAQLRGSVHKKTAALSAFQDADVAAADAAAIGAAAAAGGGVADADSSPRVLLLNVRDESASGANLTSANHAVFVHPLLASSQHEYDACETQAIGRVRRYGQRKPCTVWRFLVDETIDTEIARQRQGASLASK